jgi:L-cysteine/cystine lyase
MSVVFEEPDGSLLNVVGQRGGVCEACAKFIDREDTGRSKCLYHDSLAADQARILLQKSKSGEIVVQFYICNGKFRNFVIPISIGGEILGNVFCGQFLVQTLRRDDPKFHQLIDAMMRLGATRDLVLSYTKLPDASEIPQIARDNNIPSKEITAFELAYREMFNKTKHLSYVISAVYLLHEIAQTISLLGNAYYYTNIYTKLSNIIPEELKLILASKIEKIRSFIQMIKAQPLTNFSKEISKANELIYETLSIIEKHESEYINELLLPFVEGVLPINSSILECQKRFLIAKGRYNIKKVRTLLNPLLRDRALNPGIFTEEETKLLDECDSKLTEIERVFSMDKAEDIERFELEYLETMIKEVTDIKHQLMDQAITFEPEKHGLDDIEALVDLLTNPDSGLLGIRHKLCEERVLNELPKPFRDIREALRLRYDTVYLNWGGISPSSNFVVEEMNLWSSKIDQHGPVSVSSETILEASENIISSIRETISKFIGCKADEVILTRNTTHGITLSLASIEFSPKGSKEVDLILLTNLEHDTVHYCIRQVEKKFNVKHLILNLSSNSSARDIAKDIVSISEKRNVKVVILSHVTYNTGQILDVASIIAEVKKVLGNKSPLFLIDGAQAVGHIPVNVSALNCDFYAADAHKWIMGPRGSGFLYVKGSHLEKHKESFDFYENYMVAEKYRPRDESGRTLEPATMNVDIYVGMRRAIEVVLDAQEKAPHMLMYERIKALSKQFREQVEKKLKPYGARFINHNSTSGIVSLAFAEQQNVEFYDEMRETLDKKFHIIGRVLLNPPAIRFCISYLNSEWEVNFVVEAMKSFLEAKMPSISKKIPEIQELNLLQEKIEKKIKETFVYAKNIVSERQKLAVTRFSRFEDVEESKKIYKQTIEQLDYTKDKYLKKAKSLTSENELQKLMNEMKEEINKILYGE